LILGKRTILIKKNHRNVIFYYCIITTSNS